MKTDKLLSASRIKTLQSCSWSYACNYLWKIPQTNNSGAMRGTIAHLIFELLINKRHKHHYDKIIEKNHINGSLSINKLIIKHLKKDNIYDDDNYNLMNDMVLVGLKFDFFCKGQELLEPEYEFRLESESPEYKIRGFLDRVSFNKDTKTVLIRDFKGSKVKFRGEELESNLQAMVYSMVARKLWPDFQPVVQFLFLRFPKSPIQELRFTDAQLSGLTYALSNLYKIINDFDEKAARKNFAYDNPESKWLCGRGSYTCPYRNPSEYYSLIDSMGKVLKTAFKKDELTPKEGQKIIKMRYNGCSRHHPH